MLCPACGAETAAGARCVRCDAPLPQEAAQETVRAVAADAVPDGGQGNDPAADAAARTVPEATVADTVPGEGPGSVADAAPGGGPVANAAGNAAGNMVADAVLQIVPGVPVGETRQDGPVRERLPWPQPPFGPLAHAPGVRPRRRVSGYAGWVLAAWTVVMAAWATLVLWPDGDAPPGPVSPSPAGRQDGPQGSPDGGGTVPPPQRRYWVDTFGDAEGFREPGGRGEPAGVLREGTHYVFCKVWGRRVERGDAYNHWWLLTDLDEVYAGGGPRAYVPALYLSHWGDDEAKDNDGVEIPTCPSGLPG